MRSPFYTAPHENRNHLSPFAARVMAERRIDEQHTAARVDRLKLNGRDLAQALIGASPAEVNRLETDHSDELAAWR